MLAVLWLIFEAVNMAWPRASLAPPGAPFWQVWAVVLVSAVLVLVGTLYVLINRPHERVREAQRRQPSHA